MRCCTLSLSLIATIVCMAVDFPSWHELRDAQRLMTENLINESQVRPSWSPEQRYVYVHTVRAGIHVLGKIKLCRFNGI